MFWLLVHLVATAVLAWVVQVVVYPASALLTLLVALPSAS